MTPTGLKPYAYTRLVRRSRWRVAIPGSLVVAGLLTVLAVGTYLSADLAARHRLESRLEQIARQARYVGDPGGYLVFDERDHLLSVAPPAISDTGDSFQIISDPILGKLAVLRLPVTAVGPHIVAIPAQSEVQALDAVRRTLIGMTAAGTAAALLVGYVLAAVALRPVDAAVRERSEFVALASHQLRTPLSIIRTSAELARVDRGVTPEEAIDTILTQALRMEGLAARLTALAQAESARPSAVSADVGDVAREVVSLLRPTAERAGVTLAVDAPEPLRVRAEPAEIADVLAAVTENGIKFSPRGSPLAEGTGWVWRSRGR